MAKNTLSVSSATTRLSVSPLGLLRSVVRNRHLFAQLVRRDAIGRFRGSVMGVLWSVLLPCIMLAVYVFVFGHVFASPRAAGQGVTPAFALSLFAGMLLHGLMAECLARAPNAVLSQPSYVKKVVFPVELLPLTVVGTALVQFLLGACILLLSLSLTQGLPMTAWLWPLAWVPLIALISGLSLVLAALTVYLRDLAQITGFLATLLLFLSPVFYPLASVPAGIRQWMLYNPLTVPIETSRALLIDGNLPDMTAWSVHGIACLLALVFGWWLFQRTRRGFSDVI